MTILRTTSLSTIALAAAAPAFAETIDSAAWDTLAAITVDEIITDTSYEARKTFPADFSDRMPFDITGFVVPLGQTEDVTDFMIVSDMGFCPFCGNPEHGTSLQVSLAAPLPVIEEGMRISLRGTLEAVTDPETAQTTLMRDAVVVNG